MVDGLVVGSLPMTKAATAASYKMAAWPSEDKRHSPRININKPNAGLPRTFSIAKSSR